MNRLRQLRIRKAVCEGLIKMLETDEELLADPRQPDALQEYQRQLASIESKIAAEETAMLVGDKPAPIVVGLKTAKLFGKSNIK